MNKIIQSIKVDLPASLVVFIVAIPLSLGIALASGTSPASGLIAAAVGGLIVGLLSGSPLMVSGPAAGLTVLVFQIVQEIGLSGLAIATVIAGLIQITLSQFKAGWVFQKIPGAILNGMLAAIGLIILLGQLHVLLGQGVPQSPSIALSTIPDSLSSALFTDGIASVIWVSAIALAILIFWPKLTKSHRALSHIPAALPAVVVATLVSIPMEVSRMSLGNILGSVWNSLQGNLSALSSLEWGAILIAAGGIAAVASAESLLTARAADILAQKRKNKKGQPVPFEESNLDRELLAQGAGNTISGMIGGLPITGVIVRTAANIDAGGKTRASAVMHGFWVALFALALPVLMNQIPLAALAAVLVVTGIKLLNVGGFLKTLRLEPMNGLLWAFTIIAIVTTDLLSGLCLSLALATVFNWKGVLAFAFEKFQTTENLVGNENGELGKQIRHSSSNEQPATKRPRIPPEKRDVA